MVRKSSPPGGTVSDAGFDGPTIGRGNFVYVDVGGGIVHGYFHLAAAAVVAVGETVSAAQLLGVEGTTGHSTGAHLHFQVHTNGEPTDPRIWFTDNGVEVPELGATGTGDLPGGGGTGGEDPQIPDGFPEQIAGYRGEQLVNAGWIIKAGESQGLDAWSIEVGVMTAMGSPRCAFSTTATTPVQTPVACFNSAPVGGRWRCGWTRPGPRCCSSKPW